MDDTGSGLPAYLEAAWGLRDQPSKGPKRGLSVQRIVEAAIRIAGTDGIGALSMSRVAAEVGVGTMSLYRYVASKDELLLLMLDLPFDEPPAPPGPGEDWRAALYRWARAEFDVLRRNPWWLRIPLTAPPATPNQLAWMESGLRCLSGTGLAEGEKISVIILLSGYVRGTAKLAADMSEAAREAGTTVPEAVSGYGQTIAKLIDPLRFPALSAVLAAGALDDDPPDAPDGLEVEFVFGLERVLDGVGALVRRRAGSATGTGTG